jgi:multicomponent Na+:H+ antiporter subunit B
MKTIILKTATLYLLPLLLVFSIFILLRGHYLPGGGFVGGLVASIAFVLHAFANGLENTRKLLRINVFKLLPIGLAIAILSGLVPVFFTGEPFLTGVWSTNPLPVLGKIGSSLFFDIGVYLVVIGSSLTIIFTLSEST